MATQPVALRDIKKGDVFVNPGGVDIWKAVDDAVSYPEQDEVRCRVQFLADGGFDTRVWDNPDFVELNIRRGAAE